MSGRAMAPVPRRDLAVVTVGLALAVWLLVRAYYGWLPPLHWWMGVPLGVLAIAEGLGARTLKARLDAEREARSGTGRSTTTTGNRASVRPVEPLVVARVAVLAQASAWVAAVCTGAWIGVLAYVAPAVGRLGQAGGDTVAASVGLVCALALVVAALWLESTCRVPPDRHDGPPRDGARA